MPEYVPPKPSTVYGDDDEDDGYDEAPIADVDDEEEDEDEEDDEELVSSRRRRQQRQQQANGDSSDVPRKPKVKFTQTEDDVIVDPYASDDTYLIPILVAIGAFIPFLFCLCKL